MSEHREGGFRSNGGGRRDGGSRPSGGRREGGFRPRGGPGGFSSGPREMHKAKCSDCGNDCEVPFKPTEGREVRCKECHQKHRGY